LTWLLTYAHGGPPQASDFKESFSDYSDALKQLNGYFLPYDEGSQSIDWWLSDAPLSLKRLTAIRTMALENETVDWMQAKGAFNVIDNDWLWALHQPEVSYWQQNNRIVTHAWKRWQHGDGLEWLQTCYATNKAT
jgi:hypothetical protein